MRFISFTTSLLLAACAGHQPGESWDQANLKAHDSGCPTAIYVAPGGNLVQCEEKKHWGHDEHIHTTWDLAKQVYSSIESASLAALRESAGLVDPKNPWEYGGVVLELPGHLFVATVPETSYDIASVTVPRDYWIGDQLYVDDLPVVGNYHLHPCVAHYDTENFSANDIALANVLHVEAYLLGMCTGNIYFYSPSHDAADPHKRAWHGHIVDWVGRTWPMVPDPDGDD